MAGISPRDYEPYAQHVESQGSRTRSRGTVKAPKIGGGTKKADAPPKEPKVYNVRTIEERGVTADTIRHFKITFKHGFYKYPTFMPNGEIARIRMKVLDPLTSFPEEKNKPKYIWQKGDKAPMPPAYNLNHLTDQKEIWLVNGEPSVWVCHQAGIPAIAPFGEGRNKGYSNLFGALHEMGVQKVFIALDCDEAGRTGTLRAREAAAEFEIDCEVKRLPDNKPGFDVGDFYDLCDHNDLIFNKGLKCLPIIGHSEMETWREKETDLFNQEEKEKKESEDESNSKPARLVRMAIKVVKLIPGEDGGFYARMESPEQHDINPLSDGDFSLYLRSRWYSENKGAVIDSTSLTEAIETLKAMTLLDNGRPRPKEKVFVRTGYDDENLYLDLCDSESNVVVITPNGTWHLDRKAPVHFRRTTGVEALPVPIEGGDIGLLRPLINAEDDAQWIKICAWIIYALRGPLAPYPVLSIHGQKGSAKSTACELIRGTVDPNFVPMMPPMVDERQLYIAAKNSWVQAFDNLSGMKPEMNDALCSMATQGAMRLRKLRTDDEETLFKCIRPMIVNGIDDAIGREDFRNRCLPIYLKPILADERRQKELVTNAFTENLPEILGGFLDIVAYAHANRGKYKMNSSPRMADFAQFICDAEEVCPWPKGTFLPLVLEASHEADVVALESSLVALTLQAVMKTMDVLEGPPAELLRIINQQAPGNYRTDKTWPTTPARLTSALSRCAGNLREVGIKVDGLDPHERISGLRGIRISKMRILKGN